ncbi:MAG TPA: hypothetical protein VFG76_00105 [Candidatus Polarisedimenticolia bacterium]|nr:hypothetical protein [Candidatus Polarisedimenticolia bacterium]
METSRRGVLLDSGATEETLPELLLYTDNAFAGDGLEPPADYPLADEPHLAAWEAYREEGLRIGVLETLRARLVQLRFPVREGMSADPGYLAATRFGRADAADAFTPGLVLEQPDGLDLTLWQTAAGRIPVLVVPNRADFVALVQALTSRNEPEPVPPAMGACIVSKLNNWDRVARHRAQWEARLGATADSDAWRAEFQDLVRHPELYQDRFIVLGRQPYSAVPASDVGLDQDDWLDRSLTIRREHEFFHYFTYRVFGSARNNLHDELIADFVGMLAAFGRYSADLALRFLGLETFPRARLDGRLEVYRGDPPLSEPAMTVVRRLAHDAILNLEDLSHRHDDELRERGWRTRLTLALAAADLTELASPDMVERVDHLLARQAAV